MKLVGFTSNLCVVISLYLQYYDFFNYTAAIYSYLTEIYLLGNKQKNIYKECSACLSTFQAVVQ